MHYIPMRPHSPTGHISVTLFSSVASILSTVTTALTAEFGSIRITSPRFEFVETSFYEKSMGTPLLLEIHIFDNSIALDELANLKRRCIELELECAATYSSLHIAGESAHHIVRPVNIDGGYLTPNKLVLATTKDAAHRIYIGQGIFAESTLHYSHGSWQNQPWTYANYRRTDYRDFFQEARATLFTHPESDSVGE